MAKASRVAAATANAMQEMAEQQADTKAQLAELLASVALLQRKVDAILAAAEKPADEASSGKRGK